MRGTIVQVNISPGGLPKLPVREAYLTPLGLAGDACAHPQIHGGPLLLICSETIDELRERGYPLFYGALGENLTTAGLDRRQMRPGQRYRVGESLIELTKLRPACSALDVYGPDLQREIFDQAVKAGDVSSPKWGMSGFYAAVLETGWLRQSDIITLIEEAV
jgi:MOSC domain-containing protein YiiM